MSLSIERRSLLKMVGLGATAALPAFRPGRLASAAAAPVPKRFMAAMMFNGVNQTAFWPTGVTADTALSGVTFPKALEPLAPYKNELLIVRGLTNAACIAPGGSHTRGHTGFSGLLVEGDPPRPPPGAITIDQHIAGVIGATSKFKSITAGTVQLPGYSAVFSTGTSGIPPTSNPKTLFDRIFGGFVAPTAPTTGGTPTPAPAPTGPDQAELDALRLERKSVLDFLIKDLTATSGRLSGLDKQRMDAHLSSIREIEKRVSNFSSTTPTTGGTPTAPAAGSGASASCASPAITYSSPACVYKAPYDPREDPACRDADLPITKNNLDIIAAAFACDLTRVAAFQWGGTASGSTYTWVLPGNTTGHHDISHLSDSDPVGLDKLTKINRWHQEALAAFYAKLAAYTQADGQSLLHHSATYFTSEIGKGNSHQITDMPILIMGSAGGYFKTGRYIDVKGLNRNQNDVLISLANAFGSPVTAYGTANLCKGALPGLT